MSADEFSKVATPLAWPLTALLIVWLFYGPIAALLKRLSETLTLESVRVKVLGVEVNLKPTYARTVLNALLDEITASSNQLTAEEIALFDQILAAAGNKSIADLIPGFTRDDTAGNHERLRNLRDQKLILPRERGQWKPEKHPIVTPYGQLLAKLRTTAADAVTSFRKTDA